MRILDVQERLAGHRQLEELPHGLVQLRLSELLGQLLHLSGERDVHVERDPDQRDPGHQGGFLIDDDRPQLADHGLVVGLPADLEEVAKERAPDDVRRGGGERLGGREEHPRFLFGVELFDQPRLADAGLADDLDERPVSGLRAPTSAPRSC